MGGVGSGGRVGGQRGGGVLDGGWSVEGTPYLPTHQTHKKMVNIQRSGHGERWCIVCAQSGG